MSSESTYNYALRNRLGVTATSQELAPPEPRTREPDTHDPRERTVVSTPHTLTHDHTEDTTGTQTLDTRQRGSQVE